MPQQIKPRECKFCKSCRDGKPGTVWLVKYTDKGEVHKTGRCDLCSMTYTLNEMLGLRRER